MRVLLVDNYDSFTWNLAQLLGEGAEVTVIRNDAITVEAARAYDRIVLSPGPGLPAQAGIMPELLRELMPSHPILGVCLGMQAIVECCGGTLFNLDRVRHGVAVPCVIEAPDDPLFPGIASPFEAGLYHSWAAEPGTFPAQLRVTASSSDGVIMAVRHREFPVCGMQFHPESVLTPVGPGIVANWLAHDQHTDR
ncbi:MAG: anthranilate synthase component II [Flavobacteriales bacterium]